jgi:hypothetical protein
MRKWCRIFMHFHSITILYYGIHYLVINHVRHTQKSHSVNSGGFFDYGSNPRFRAGLVINLVFLNSFRRQYYSSILSCFFFNNITSEFLP